ncbi:MAG: rhodanese-like domain-containing protein [Acidimicrobiia bacterium]
MRTEPAGKVSSSPATSIPIEGLEPVEVVAALDGETVLIDLRGQLDAAVADGIPGAIPMTAGVLASWAAGSQPDMPFGLEKDRRIIVYSSDDSESRRVVESLRDMGFGRVAYLIGGLDSWKRRNRGETASTDATGSQGG